MQRQLNGNGRRDGYSTAMDSTAMDGKGMLEDDLTRMDKEERREHDGDRPQAQW